MYRCSCPLLGLPRYVNLHVCDSDFTRVPLTSSLFLLSWLAAVFLWTKQGRNKLPTTAWRLQILVKQRTEQKTERRDGAPLLSRGLRLPIILSTCWQVGCHSVCLATQLPSSSPLQDPITVYHVLWRGSYSHLQANGEEDRKSVV